VLRQRPGAPSLEHVEVVQPVLFSVHVALAELWMANGVVPQTVIGQSQGEIAAACVAGALTLEDAVHIIVSRSQLFADELVGRGGIASIGLAAREATDYLAPYQGRLEIAGIIGANSVTSPRSAYCPSCPPAVTSCWACWRSSRSSLRRTRGAARR
jgi:polyketide synthase 7